MRRQRRKAPRLGKSQPGARSRRPQLESAAQSTPVTTLVLLRLYIAGDAPNSVLAIENLKAICQEYLKDCHKLEVIDVLEQPLRAMAEGVLVTPSLAKLSPLPGVNVVGNLSDKAKVLLALGLKR
jgi:circadian clock protein KaiB